MTMHQAPRDMRGIVAVRADAGGDPRAIFAELQTAFAAFRDEHAAQIGDLRKGLDDVVRVEKVDRINADVGKLQSALDTAVSDIAALKLGGAGGSDDKVKDAEYTDAFRAHFRKGDVKAALNKGAADEGGYLAPVEWDRTITDQLVQVSPMRSIAAVQQISTAGFTKLFNARGTTSGWVGENAARPQTGTPTFGSLTYTTGEIYANPAATQQMLDDAAVNLEAWLSGEVELEFAYQEGIAFVSGNGTNKPNGLLTYAAGAANAAAHPWGAIPQVDAAATTAIDPDELIDLVYDLPTEFSTGARFIMNRTTQAEVRKLKDSDGRYLWQPSYQAGEPATLLMYPITEMPAMPSIAAGAIPIAFGDFRRGYLIVDRVGVRVLRDPFTNKPYVHFYTTKRVGGGLLNPEVLRLFKMAAA
ncbi:phage major capsid protein [Acuticoccus sediminis]|uniref:Phage major capsid protein n=1 Tax=Acuticoccus sediminis TaxID=2184697 RepID=A0A8B2NQB2_9HYPH|nr:phage major capsid protein [Acuticoccus sediminis]RAH99201.1 phage major capsid protein [Acuticoccus sediminis]